MIWYRVIAPGSMQSSGYTPGGFTYANGMSLWFRVISGEGLLWRDDRPAGAPYLEFSVENTDSETFDLVYDPGGDLSGPLTLGAGLDVGEWHHLFVTCYTGSIWMQINGGPPTSGGSDHGMSSNVTFAGTGDLIVDFTNIFCAETSAGYVWSWHVVTALYDGGPEWNGEDSTGLWTFGGDIIAYWRTLAASGSVPNSVGGVHPLALSLPAYASTEDTGATRVRRIGTVAGPMYPPIRTYYALPGTTNGGLRAIGSRLPRLVFPSVGGVGNFSWRGWIRRPTSPAQTAGTLLGIHIGDISIRVTISIGNLLGVTVDDGTSDETDTAVVPLPELSWVAVSMVVADDGSVILYVGDTVYASIDISALSFPGYVEDTTDTTYTIGTDIGGTDPIDLDIKGIANWDVALTPEEVAALVPKGPDFDVRNTDPVTPEPVEYWIEPIDGVVPGVEEPLIPMSDEVLDEIEPSDINLWASGDHRLGIYSSAWWDGTALDPASWSLAFLDSSLEDSFGEAPRIVVVTVRSDGALTLDLDARMMPGVSYELSGPADLAGSTPPPSEGEV